MCIHSRVLYSYTQWYIYISQWSMTMHMFSWRRVYTLREEYVRYTWIFEPKSTKLIYTLYKQNRSENKSSSCPHIHICGTREQHCICWEQFSPQNGVRNRETKHWNSRRKWIGVKSCHTRTHENSRACCHGRCQAVTIGGREQRTDALAEMMSPRHRV